MENDKPWRCVKYRAPQGSALEPLLLKIYFLDNLFAAVTNCMLSNYVNDTTLYASSHDNKEIKERKRYPYFPGMV